MKIVVLDGYTENPGDLSWAQLEELGDVTIYENTEPDQMADRIGDAEVIIVNKLYVTRELLDQVPSVKLVLLFATGYNKIDLEACKEKGIMVCNAPEYGTYGVSQHTIALLLEVCVRCGSHSEAVKEGQWEKSEQWCFWNYPIVDLRGKTLGIIGYGNIGQEVGHIAEAFGMEVLYNKRHHSPDDGLDTAHAHFAEVDELLRESDIVSLHCPLTAENENLIDEEAIEKMKDGAILINTARGGLVDEEALLQALKSGKLYAAGLDVVKQEPIPSDHPFLSLDNCILTPHIAWASKACRQKVLDIVCDNLKAYQKGEKDIRTRVC